MKGMISAYNTHSKLKRMNSNLKLEKLHHVTIHVKNITEARAFYENIPGIVLANMPLSVSEKGIIWYNLPDGRQIHLFPWEEDISQTRAHFALTVENIEAWHSFFKNQGCEIIEPMVNYGAERFFIRDPSGNLIEFLKLK